MPHTERSSAIKPAKAILNFISEKGVLSCEFGGDVCREQGDERCVSWGDTSSLNSSNAILKY